MKKIILSILFLVLTQIAAFAVTDSIGIKFKDGKKYILHQIDKGETFYALSRKYHVPVADIQKVNPELVSSFSVGSQALIPIKNSGTTNTQAEVTNNTTTTTKKEETKIKTEKVKVPIIHTVAKSEGLYRISTMYKVTVAQIKEWNHMNSESLELGQELIVGYKTETKTTTSTETKTNNTKTDSKVTTSNDPKMSLDAGDVSNEALKKEFEDYAKIREEKINAGKVELLEVRENGQAGSVDDASIIAGKSLALHASAPPGTIVKITNLMNDKSVYVKVIAKLPKIVGEPDLSIKITKSAADELGVLDKYFRVQMSYTKEYIRN